MQVCRSSPEFTVEFMLGHSLTYYICRAAPACLCQRKTGMGPGPSPQGPPKVLKHCLRDAPLKSYSLLALVMYMQTHMCPSNTPLGSCIPVFAQTLTRVYIQTPTFMCPQTYLWTQTHVYAQTCAHKH